MPCRKKEKSNEWSKRFGTGMPFIIGDSNCRGSVRIMLENGQGKMDNPQKLAT
jgi:hypothetical protein